MLSSIVGLLPVGLLPGTAFSFSALGDWAWGNRDQILFVLFVASECLAVTKKVKANSMFQLAIAVYRKAHGRK